MAVRGKPSPAILVGFFFVSVDRRLSVLLDPSVHIALDTQRHWAPLFFCAMTGNLQELLRHTVMNGILHHLNDPFLDGAGI